MSTEVGRVGRQGQARIVSDVVRPDEPYRPDIDGLRALAIVPVVLYHAGYALFSGGFVGVDVFFVISGFLITSLIVRQINNGAFTLPGFWVRRARRILPALGVVVLFTLVAGWILYSPSEYKGLGREVLTQAFFSSNVYFWLTSGYFAAPSETKPLLHTWSLSVEEQYYLFMPLLLVVLARCTRRFAIGVVSLLLVASLCISVWLTFRHPDAAFFLAYSRAWELLIGSLLALLTLHPRSVATGMPRWVNELFSAVGLAAILYGTMVYDSATRFPGIAAVVPCLGAAAAIWSNGNAPTFAGRILTHRAMVQLGVLSYSLYLWHWPLLAFARYLSPYKLSVGATTLVIIASVPVAWLSYRYIEMPVRCSPRARRATIVFPAALALLSFMLLAGTYVNVTDGVRWRKALDSTFASDLHSVGRRSKLCRPVTSVAMPYDNICRLGSVSNSRGKVFLVGDSFAEMYLPAFEVLSWKYQREVWYVKRQHVPVYPELMDVIQKNDISRVVLSYSWARAKKGGIPELYPHDTDESGWSRRFRSVADYDPMLVIGDTTASLRQNLSTLVGRLRQLHLTVCIIDSPPYYPVSVSLKLGILVNRGGDPTRYGSTLSKHLAEQAGIYSIFQDIGAPDVQILRVTDVLCDSSGFCRTYGGGHSLYADEMHLSEYGADLTVPVLERIFAPPSGPNPGPPQLTPQVRPETEDGNTDNRYKN